MVITKHEYVQKQSKYIALTIPWFSKTQPKTHYIVRENIWQSNCSANDINENLTHTLNFFLLYTNELVKFHKFVVHFVCN